MSCQPCKRKLQFYQVAFDQNGKIIPRKRPRLTVQIENPVEFSETKRREEVSEGKTPRRPPGVSTLTPDADQIPQSYRKIAPCLLQTPIGKKSETDGTKVNCSKSTTQKSVRTTSVDENVNWVQRVKAFVTSKASHLHANSWKYGDDENCIVTLRDLSRYTPDLVLNAGVAPVSLHVFANGDYVVKVLFRDTSVKGTLKEARDIGSLVSILTNYVVCPGLKAAPPVESTSKRTWGFPFDRTDSNQCRLLHAPRNKKQEHGSLLYDVCDHCKKLHFKLLDIAKKRARNGTDRLSKSSKCNWRFLSPKSAKKKIRNLSSDACRLNKEVRRLNKKVQVNLSAELSEQMAKLTGKIASQFQGDLDSIFEEAEKKVKGNGRLMQEVWKRDVEDRKAFWRDQTRNGNTGGTGNRWSTVTYRIALAVYTRSPAAYEALKSYSILNLPSVSSLKKFSVANHQPVGSNHAHLQDARNTYTAYKSQRKTEGFPEPKSTGVLIFDEVKVVMKLHWNSANNSFVGHAMTADDMASLEDVYEQLQAPKAVKASYMLQFLWRDLTSDFDIIGPYFNSGNGMECKFIIACLTTTIQAFHIYGFKTMAVVCDGASPNLKAIKYLTTEKSGAYGINGDINVDEPHHIKSWMLNPWTNEKLFFIPCPSHQLKSLIAALHSSRKVKEKQLKNFDLFGVHFGWQVLQDLWKREMKRARSGKMRRVPQLCYRHIFRDCWTRLNVKPAKIMQQNQVIAELTEYMEADPPDAENVAKTIEYLNACRLLFERGILGHEKIANEQSPLLQNMSDGYDFFVGWADYAWEQEPNLTSSSQKGFLAWQTWDLTRLMYYGFTEFCQSFLQKFPGYYIWPLRLNGSALETIFSQLKFNMNGQLSSVNYAPALTTLKLKRQIHGWRGKFVYRRTPLYIRELPLKRLKR